MLHRVPFDGYIENLAKKVRGNEGIVLFDADDLVFDSSAAEWARGLAREDVIRIGLHKRDVDLYRKTLEEADALLLSTDFLGRQTLAFGKPVWVHRNAFSLEMLRLSDAASSRRNRTAGEVIIGYASGTPTHDRDFQEARPALMEILGRYPAARLRIVGPLDPGDGWGSLAGRIERVPFVPWQHLPSILAGFDINIAPLERGNPFCEAKSEIKYVEAGLVGVPTVASSTDAFVYAIRSGENGFLASGYDDWLDALRRLVEDREAREEMGRRARDDVLARYHPAVRAAELISTLNDISRTARGYPIWQDEALPRVSHIPSSDEPLPASLSATFEDEPYPSLLDRTLYSLRYRGPRIFLMQAWVFLKRRLRRLTGSPNAG